jgi:hypothetical protein
MLHTNPWNNENRLVAPTGNQRYQVEQQRFDVVEGGAS